MNIAPPPPSAAYRQPDPIPVTGPTAIRAALAGIVSRCVGLSDRGATIEIDHGLQAIRARHARHLPEGGPGFRMLAGMLRSSALENPEALPPDRLGLVVRRATQLHQDRKDVTPAHSIIAAARMVSSLAQGGASDEHARHAFRAQVTQDLASLAAYPEESIARGWREGVSVAAGSGARAASWVLMLEGEIESALKDELAQ